MFALTEGCVTRSGLKIIVADVFKRLVLDRFLPVPEEHRRRDFLLDFGFHWFVVLFGNRLHFALEMSFIFSFLIHLATFKYLPNY